MSSRKNLVDSVTMVKSRFTLSKPIDAVFTDESFLASDECSLRSLNTCDDNADCVDLPNGYTCQCAAGFIDVSHSANLPPGRVCTLRKLKFRLLIYVAILRFFDFLRNDLQPT